MLCFAVRVMSRNLIDTTQQKCKKYISRGKDDEKKEPLEHK